MIVNLRVPVRWHGRDLIAVHADTCRCYEPVSKGHLWRVVYADTFAYLWDERDAWVIHHASPPLPGSDPFGG